MRLALYHPQIPQNTGTLMRFCACMGIGIDLIHPLGFILDNKRLLRSCMDYAKSLDLKTHNNFESFLEFYKNHRIIAMDLSEDSQNYANFQYNINDILIAGTEAFGFLPKDREKIHFAVQIPMKKNLRSLNIAIAASIITSHALLTIK